MSKSFKFGNDVINYYGPVDEFNEIYYFGMPLIHICLEKCDEHKGDVIEKYGFAVDLIDEFYLCFKDFYIKKGIYDFSLQNLRSETQYQYIVFPIEQLARNYAETVDAIDEEREIEKERRALRKDLRGRVVGGGFGVSGALQGMAMAGAINMTTGLAHSAFNMVGNAADAISASNEKDKALKDFNSKYVSYVLDALLSTFSLIRQQLDITFHVFPDKTEAILKNIDNSQLNDELKITALKKALEENPYSLDAYLKIIESYPLLTDDVAKIADYFKVDIKDKVTDMHQADGVYFAEVEDKLFVNNNVLWELNKIQKKYVSDGSQVLNNKKFFLDTLNFPFINEIITVLDNVSVEPKQIHVLEYIENKKQFYIPLRNEMKEIYDKKSIDYGLLNIQTKFLNTTDNAYSSRDYFLSSLNFPFIDELIAYLEGVTVDPENNKLREYIEAKKQFYFHLRNDMEGLAAKKYIDDELLNIQANYSTETRNVVSDRNYFIESRNLPFINAIITFLNGVTVKPEESALLEYIEDRKKFYLTLQKEVEEFCAECKQIEEITKGRFFSTNVEELKSWNDALSKKEFHTPRATEIVTTIQLLASYSQKDLDTLVLFISMLPKDNGVTTIDENNFTHIQKQFTSRVKDNEIVLSYTGNGFAVDSWMLTTQRFYIATVGYNLADILAIVCIDNYLLVIAQPEDKNQAKRTYLISFGFDKTQLLNITKSLSAICHKYLEKNLPETSSKYLTYEYYFYNDIMPNLINKSQSYYFVSVHDGTNAPIDYQIRKVSGRDTFIFRYITSTGAGNKGMALTDQGLIIEQPFDTNKTLLKWEELVNADIYVKKKGFFSKDEMFINGQTYSLGNSDAKTEDWVSYLRKMIAAYKLCIMNYPIFIQKIQSLPNFPPLKDTPSLQHIVYIPPQPVPTPSGPASTVTDTPSTPDNKKETKSSMFSSFKSSIMSTSKSALDKAADIGAKTSSSFASSFMNKTKSAFGIGKDDGTKYSENTSPNIEEPEPVSSSKNIDGDRVCPNCGASMAKDQLFCGKCGTKYVDTQNKKLCPSCGAEVEDGMKFCRICGAKLNVNQPKFCPNCGSKLAEGTKFCGNCGNKV